jgi:hypothetical protein
MIKKSTLSTLAAAATVPALLFAGHGNSSSSHGLGMARQWPARGHDACPINGGLVLV